MGEKTKPGFHFMTVDFVSHFLPMSFCFFICKKYESLASGSYETPWSNSGECTKKGIMRGIIRENGESG